MPEDFYLDATEGCRHKPEARRRYLAMLAERFDTPLTSVLSDTPKILHEHLSDLPVANTINALKVKRKL